MLARRHTDPDRGDRRGSRLHALVPFGVRVGALALLAIPVVQFVVSYAIATGSLDGIVEYAPVAAVDGAVAAFTDALADPLPALLLLLLGSATVWLAFGPRRRR
jgi:hypothetical protein